jgi:hypothetical protein
MNILSPRSIKSYAAAIANAVVVLSAFRRTSRQMPAMVPVVVPTRQRALISALLLLIFVECCWPTIETAADAPEASRR